MSVKVMTAVWKLQLSAFEKLLLLALADIADDEGRCYPAMRHLEEKCGMSESTVRRSLCHLEAAGHLQREYREGRSTLYHICRETSISQTPLSNRHPCPIDTPVSLTGGGVSLTPPEKKKTSSLDPSLTRHSGGRAKAESEEPPPPNLNVEAWHRWVQYRKTIRKPIHPASRLSAQRKLAGFGADQTAVVEQSIANGWQGLFALKDQPKRAEESRPRRLPPDAFEVARRGS